MSAPAAVHFEKRGEFARITFDRPGARNAMTWAMYDQLSAALDQLESDATIRVAEFRGAGGNFVAGTDIKQFESFASADDGVEYERQLEAIVRRLEMVRVPTVAVVQGHAAGAGLLFAMACDVRICTPDALFSAPIAKTVGNTLSLRAVARLVAHLGPSRVKALIMTAAAMEADEARAAGFVGSVVEVERLEQRVSELLSRLASLAPLTLRATKQMVTRVLDTMSLTEGEDIVRQVYGSRDFREGVNAFAQKRAPSWESR